jgi:hypothetical protein
MHRELLATYALVGGCALVGFVVAVFVIDYEPRLLMGVYGAGAGLMVGAFIAAIASNEPLVGGGSRREPLFPQSPPPHAPGLRGSLNGHASTNGHGGSYEDDSVEESEGDKSRRDRRST